MSGNCEKCRLTRSPAYPLPLTSVARLLPVVSARFQAVSSRGDIRPLFPGGDRDFPRCDRYFPTRDRHCLARDRDFLLRDRDVMQSEWMEL